MNKKEAIQAMLEGKIVTKTYWDDSEYIYYNNEAGAFCGCDGSKYDRINGVDSENWEIWKEETYKRGDTFINKYNDEIYIIMRNGENGHALGNIATGNLWNKNYIETKGDFSITKEEFKEMAHNEPEKFEQIEIEIKIKNT